MGKETKVRIKYRYGQLPEGIGALLENADETDLRILVALMMLADKDSGEVGLSELYERLGADGGDVKASLKYWKGAGIVEETSQSSGENAAKPQKESKALKDSENIKANKGTAHKNGVLEQGHITGNYTTRELTEILEKRIVSPQFIDEAQRIMGKTFRIYDIGILVGIVERLGFEEEAVLVILGYISGKGKKTMRYAETFAIALYDEGITETSALIARIEKIERSGEVIEQIKGLYGIRDRALTSTEKRLFAAWTEKLAFDIDVIRLAYDITVDNTQKPLPKYTNSILERWYADGLRDADEVKKYLARQGEEKGNTVKKSYDADEFFEAALQRSYEELK